VDDGCRCHRLVTPFSDNVHVRFSKPVRAGHPAPIWLPLSPAGDEALLPAGTRLADEARPTRQCFLLVNGGAQAEAAGCLVRRYAAGSFIGSVDASGRPAPTQGLTVRLTRRSRLVVFDAGRLAALVAADPAAVAAWDRVIAEADR
jgi:hypothetical protein